MRFFFGLLMLAMPAVALAQDIPAQPKLPGPNESGKAVLVIDSGGHNSLIFGLLFTRDGKKLISVDADKTVQIWDTVTGERLKVFRLPRNAKQPLVVSNAAIAPDNVTLAISGFEFGSTDGSKWGTFAFLLHLESGQLLQLPGFKHYGGIRGVAFSGDGEHLAIGIGQVADEGKKKMERSSIQVWSGMKNV